MAKTSMTLDDAHGHHGKIVKYYRCVVMDPPRGWTQEQLAEAMKVSVRWIQEMERMPYIHSISRRKALAVVLSIPAALLNLGEDERLFNHGTLRFESWILDSLENGTRSHWQLYYTSNNIITEQGLLNQIEILEQLADDGSKERHRIYRVLAQNYQLAGSLARDNFSYSNAKKYFREAQRLANEGQSSDLVATAVARHALVLLRQERVEEALEMYQSAIELTEGAQPHVKSYVYAGLAEALARNHCSNECYRTLDQAQKCNWLGVLENLSKEGKADRVVP